MKQKDQHKEQWDAGIKKIRSEDENPEVVLNQKTMHQFSSQKVQTKW